MSILSPSSHLPAVRELKQLLTQHRQLTWAMTKREISDRYAGQVLGLFWAIGHPLAQMAVYIFLFALVFKARMGGTRELPLDYVAYLLAGLLPWIAFQETIGKSSLVVVSNANLVKQVVFPVEVLPVKGALAAMFTQTITSTVLIGYVLYQHGGLFWTYALIPVLWSFQLLAMVGVAYLLSAIGVFFRDIKDLVQVSMLLSTYLMPIVYLPEWVPEVLRPLLYLNPFSYMIWCYQDVLYYGRFEHPYAFVVFCGGALVVFYGGFRLFRKLKPHFGNAL